MSTVVTWLGTYWIHSTILLAIAWALDHALRDRPDWREPIWRAALLGGLVTATAQVAAPIRPWGGTWFASAAAEAPGALADEDARAAARDQAITAEPPVIAVHVAPERARRGEERTVAIHIARMETGVAPAAAAPPARFGLREAALAGWGLGAAILLFGLWRSWRALERRLAGRHGLEGTPIQELLWSLTARSPRAPEPRLTASARVTMPMALGILRPEICLPERALIDLSPEAQAAMLAHELGHVARRDPLWRLVAEVVARTLFFQPLNWLAARRLSACAELLADDWAARRTTEPLSLAECLTTVAQWAAVQRRGGLASSMAGGDSELGQRVDRLVRGEGLVRSGRQPRWSGPAVVAALIALALLAPSGCAANEAAAKPAAAPTPEARHGKVAAEVRREVEEAQREVEEAQREVEEAQREVEEAQRAIEEGQREAREAAREASREARREAREAAREARREAKRKAREAREARKHAEHRAHPHPRGRHPGHPGHPGHAGPDDDDDDDDSRPRRPRHGRIEVKVPPIDVNVPPIDIDIDLDGMNLSAEEWKELHEEMARAREQMRAELHKNRAQLDEALREWQKNRDKVLKDAAKFRAKAMKEAAKARKKAEKKAGRRGGANPYDDDDDE